MPPFYFAVQGLVFKPVRTHMTEKQRQMKAKKYLKILILENILQIIRRLLNMIVGYKLFLG
jgi:hypothetical protein